jgi:hypothetical protein
MLANATARLSQPREATTTVVVGETALFVGGWTAGTPLPTVDLFDATTATWSTATLSEARVAPATAVIGDLLIIAGGVPRNGGASRAVDIYDARSGTWTAATLSRPLACVLTYAGRRYDAAPAIVVAGRYALFVFQDAVDVLDTDSAAWATQALAEPRTYPTVAVFGETVLIAGGTEQRGFYMPSAAVDVFEGAAGTCSQAQLSARRTKATSVTVGSTAIIAGGIGASDPSERRDFTANSADLYDGASGTWSSAPLSGCPRHTATRPTTTGRRTRPTPSAATR